MGVGVGVQRAAAEQLDQHHARGIDVVARAELAVIDVLRCHVARRARHALARARIIDATGDAEVHHPRPSALVDQHVARLEVAVDHALAVGLGERGEHAEHQRDGLGSGQGATAAHQRGQCFALDVLEHQVGIAAFLARFEHRHDAGMAQAAHRTRFAEQGGVVAALGRGQVQGLERDLALELRIPRQMHHALRAAPQLTSDFEPPDPACHLLPCILVRSPTPASPVSSSRTLFAPSMEPSGWKAPSKARPVCAGS